jgi:hypothetical protein
VGEQLFGGSEPTPAWEQWRKEVGDGYKNVGCTHHASVIALQLIQSAHCTHTGATNMYGYSCNVIVVESKARQGDSLKYAYKKKQH